MKSTPAASLDICRVVLKYGPSPFGPNATRSRSCSRARCVDDATKRPNPADSAKPRSCPACGWSPGAPLSATHWPTGPISSISTEINREFERLHQLMRELDTLLDESQTLRRHIGVATARLALCLREAEDEPQDDHL